MSALTVKEIKSLFFLFTELICLLPILESLIIWLVSCQIYKRISENTKYYFHGHLRMQKIVIQPKPQYNTQLLKTQIRFVSCPKLVCSTLKKAYILEWNLLYGQGDTTPTISAHLKTLDSFADQNHQIIPTFSFWVP